MKFISDRNIPLITQIQDLYYSLLTVEKYCKWYDIYIIKSKSSIITDNMVEKLSYDNIDDNLNLWEDHCINPRDFIDLSISLNAKCDIQTYDTICRRYYSDRLGTGVIGTKEEFLERSELSRGYADLFPTEEDLEKVILKEDQILL